MHTEERPVCLRRPGAPLSVSENSLLREKAAQRERGGAQNADPADFRVSRHGAQQEIQPHRRAKRKQGTDELPTGKSEKDCFPVFPNFLWNLYLDRLQLLLF